MIAKKDIKFTVNVVEAAAIFKLIGRVPIPERRLYLSTEQDELLHELYNQYIEFVENDCEDI